MLWLNTCRAHAPMGYRTHLVTLFQNLEKMFIEWPVLDTQNYFAILITAVSCRTGMQYVGIAWFPPFPDLESKVPRLLIISIFTCFFCCVSCLTGCAMSGLIADAKTLIDKARVETQVWKSAVYFAYQLWLIFILRSSTEPLVHLWWDHDGGEHNPGSVQPGTAVWGGGRRPWCDGESLCSSSALKRETW